MKKLLKDINLPSLKKVIYDTLNGEMVLGPAAVNRVVNAIQVGLELAIAVARALDREQHRDHIAEIGVYNRALDPAGQFRLP